MVHGKCETASFCRLFECLTVIFVFILSHQFQISMFVYGGAADEPCCACDGMLAGWPLGELGHDDKRQQQTTKFEAAADKTIAMKRKWERLGGRGIWRGTVGNRWAFTEYIYFK